VSRESRLMPETIARPAGTSCPMGSTPPQHYEVTLQLCTALADGMTCHGSSTSPAVFFAQHAM
jgi:hypothetical protein